MGGHKCKRQTNKCQLIFSFALLSIPAHNFTVCRFRNKFIENEPSASSHTEFSARGIFFCSCRYHVLFIHEKVLASFVQKDLNYYQPTVLPLALFSLFLV